MGSCANTKEVDNFVHVNRKTPSSEDNSTNKNSNKFNKNTNTIGDKDLLNRPSDAKFLDDFLEPKFKNFPEESEVFQGEGVKRIKAYKSTIKIDQLIELRNEFFENRIRNQGSIWKQIRYACIYDPVRCENLLTALKLTPINGCMNQLLDVNGNIYVIPNFCINDPLTQKELLGINKNHKENSIKVNFVNAYTQEKNSLKIDDNINVHDLKTLYCMDCESCKDPSKVRMFYGGAELVNSNYLYQHELKDGCMINVMIRKE